MSIGDSTPNIRFGTPRLTACNCIFKNPLSFTHVNIPKFSVYQKLYDPCAKTPQGGWSSLRWLASLYGWWGCVEHCVRARCETGRKEQVRVGEEGRSRDVLLHGVSGWLSSSASTGWRALNAKRPRRLRRCAPSTAHTPSQGRRPPT